jgi:hypothetical protein
MSSSVSPEDSPTRPLHPDRSPGTSAEGPAHRYTAFMLKGSKTAVVTKIQPVSIHGQISLDVYYHDPDDSQAQVRLARVGQESVPRGLEAGDRVELHYVLGVVTHITKA